MLQEEGAEPGLKDDPDDFQHTFPAINIQDIDLERFCYEAVQLFVSSSQITFR